MKLFVLFFLSVNAFALTGLEVMLKVDKANQGYIGASSQMTMTLVDGHGNKVEREMRSMILEDNKVGDKSIMEFLKPMDVKGTKLLTWTLKDGDNQQWLYLPRFKRVKKINSRNQAGSFMGSEFSFEDIAGSEVDKYTYKLLADKEESWEVESVPKQSSGYSKIVSVISKKLMGPLSADYYDRKGELVKKSKLGDYKSHSVKGKTFHLADKVRMDNVQTKRSSIITWKQRELGVQHRESEFKSNKLK